ncbi:MAG: class I SAM-dependent methyltransferase, partial [Methylocella sp.]
GVDISPAMISEAEKNCRQFGAQAVTFCRTANEIAPNSADLVTSIIVLQHIRIKQGLRIIEDLLDTLVVGGVAALDVTVYRKFPMKNEIVYRIKNGIPGAWVLLNLIHGKRLSEPPMEMNEYPLDAVLEIYHRKGMDNIVLQPVFGSSWGFAVIGQRRR